MNHELQLLADRVAALEVRGTDLASYLQAALNYLASDPQSSLTKSRVILEKILVSLHSRLLGKPPARPMIGDILADKVLPVLFALFASTGVAFALLWVLARRYILLSNHGTPRRVPHAR